MTSTRTVELNLRNIEDQVAAFLYATKEVRENQEIVDMEFGTPKLDGKGNQIVPLKIAVREEGGESK